VRDLPAVLSVEVQIAMIRVVLRRICVRLRRVKGEVTVEVEGTASVLSVLDALEAKYPMPKVPIPRHATRVRRPFLRFFACEEIFRTNRSMRRSRGV